MRGAARASGSNALLPPSAPRAATSRDVGDTSKRSSLCGNRRCGLVGGVWCVVWCVWWLAGGGWWAVVGRWCVVRGARCVARGGARRRWCCMLVLLVVSVIVVVVGVLLVVVHSQCRL